MAAQGVPQIRSQVNISGQQPRIANQLGLGNTRIATSSVMQARVLAQAQAQAQAVQAAQAQAQQQGIPVSTSLAAGAAPALNAHLSTPFNARATSASPGVGQQSPPPQVPQNTATSPRPPSAQAVAQVQAQMNLVAQAQVAQPTRANPHLAAYYAAVHGGHLTSEQLSQAHIRAVLMQQVRIG